MAERLKVLFSAYACEPGKGSEPGVGWNWALQMARHHDVTVLTRANNRPAIEREPSSHMPHLTWAWYDLPGWLRFWKRGARGARLYYQLWQIVISWIGRRLLRRQAFDLVHHVTFGKYYVPCYLALLPVKAVIGPVGGGESCPPALRSTLSLRGRLFELARDWGRAIAGLDPLLRLTLRRADLVFATTEETAVRLRRLGGARVEVLPQCGLTAAELDYFGQFPLRRDAPFRVISICRLVAWKGLHLSLSAFAQFAQDCPDAEYWIVNDGPELSRLRRLAVSLGIAGRVKFWGRLRTHADVHEKLAQCDVLAHPALHEAFGNVCLEAMAAGRPVICLDTGGPALQVTAATGCRIRIGDPETVVREMAEAMRHLHDDPDHRWRLATASRERAREVFQWENRAAQMATVYQGLEVTRQSASCGGCAMSL